MIGHIHVCDKPTHSDDGCSVSRPCCIDHQCFHPFWPERCIRCTLVENLYEDCIYPHCLACTHLPFATLARSALNTLVILTGGGTDKLLISASPLQPRDKLAAAVIHAFEWILANNSGRLTPGLPCTIYLFIYLFILFVLGQNRWKRDRLKFIFAFFGRSHQCKTIRKLPSSLEN